MKRVLLFFALIFLLCLPATAKMTLIGGGLGGVPTAGTAGYCTGAATCNTPPQYCDVACEDHEGSSACGDGSHSNCRNTWAVTKDASDTLDFNATASGTYPCSGTENTNGVLQLSSVYGRSTRISLNPGNNDGQVALQFYAAVPAKNFSSGDRGFLVFVGHAETSGTALRIDLYNDSGTYKWQLYYYNGGAAYLTSTASYTDDTWYRFRVKWNDSTGDVSFAVDDETPQTADDVSADNKANYLTINPSMGCNSWTIEIDNIAFDNSSANGQSDCS